MSYIDREYRSRIHKLSLDTVSLTLKMSSELKEEYRNINKEVLHEFIFIEKTFESRSISPKKAMYSLDTLISTIKESVLNNITDKNYLKQYESTVDIAESIIVGIKLSDHDSREEDIDWAL